jgi:hypothetical protein
MERKWKYKGYKCETWLTDDGNIKFHAIREDEDTTDRKSGMLITPTNEKTEDKIGSGVSELNERIDSEIEEIRADYI